MDKLIHPLFGAAPLQAELTGRHGSPCRFWRNPTKSEFADTIQRDTTDGLRGILTAADLYVWQSNHLLHADFERATGIFGVRLALRSGEIQVDDGTTHQPDHFPWIFQRDASDMAMDTRRTIVAAWLASSDRLNRLYAQGFKVTW